MIHAKNHLLFDHGLSGQAATTATIGSTSNRVYD